MWDRSICMYLVNTKMRWLGNLAEVSRYLFKFPILSSSGSGEPGSGCQNIKMFKLSTHNKEHITQHITLFKNWPSKLFNYLLEECIDKVLFRIYMFSVFQPWGLPEQSLNSRLSFPLFFSCSYLIFHMEEFESHLYICSMINLFTTYRDSFRILSDSHPAILEENRNIWALLCL